MAKGRNKKTDLSLTAQNKTEGSHILKLSGNPTAKSGHAESSPHLKPLARAYVRVSNAVLCLPVTGARDAQLVHNLHDDYGSEPGK